MKINSMYTLIDALTYNNTLLVYPDPLGVSVNVTCIAMNRGINYNDAVILQGMLNQCIKISNHCLAPSDPPCDVNAYILNSTSIKVNWTTSSQANGYVIESTTGDETRNVVSTTEDEIELTNLSMRSTYTINVYLYRDLPSVNSTQTVLKFDGEFVPLRT